MNQNPFGNNPFGTGPGPAGNKDPLGEMLEAMWKKQKKGKKKKPESGKEEPEKFDSNGNPVRKKKRAGRTAGILLAVIVVGFLSMNSFYVLDEENYAVVTTLGSPAAQSQAGLHFKIPLIQNVRFVSKGIKGMAIGYDQETREAKEDESVMITKDFNFVNTDFYLEYMVDDPVKYLYASEEPEATLKMLAQSYIRDTVGIHNVDDVITTGKAEIQSEIKELLTNRMIEEDIGLSVVNISIQDAFPPTTEVMNAFKNVENAKQGKETAINNANKDRNEKIPQAEAECDQIIKNAEADREARINEAEGQVARFNQMYAEYSKYPLITKQRMFYEAMEDVLPDMKVYIVDDDGTQKMLPLEPFSTTIQAGEMSRQSQSGAGNSYSQEEQRQGGAAASDGSLTAEDEEVIS